MKYTGEESIILTASVADGTVSQLGSSYGKTFPALAVMKNSFALHCLQSKYQLKVTGVRHSVHLMVCKLCSYIKKLNKV